LAEADLGNRAIPRGLVSPKKQIFRDRCHEFVHYPTLTLR
jgi:hypothetical protein